MLLRYVLAVLAVLALTSFSGCTTSPVEFTQLRGLTAVVSSPTNSPSNTSESDDYDDDRNEDPFGWGQPTLEVSGFYVPSLKVKADEDETERDQGIEFDADLNHGSGFGVRVAGRGEKNTGVALLYITTKHTERETRRDARLHQAYVELFARTPPIHDYISPTFGAAIGVGGAVYDFRQGFDDTGGAAGMIRGEVGITVAKRLDLTFGGAGFLWGYPGETVGYGGFISFQGHIRF